MWDVNLDLSFNICNASCSWCFVPHYPPHYPKQFLTIENCKKFIDLHKEYVSSCTLSIAGFGEPLLNPHFFEIITLLKQANFKLGALTTNLSTKLSKEQIYFLVSSFSTVVINMGGDAPSCREKNMKIAQDFFLDNVKILRSSPYTNYSLLLLNSGISQAPKPFETRAPEIFCENLCKRSTQNVGYSQYLQPFGTPRSFQEIACNADNQFRILSTGEVLLCCYIPYHPDAVVGNAFERSLATIITSSRFTKSLDAKHQRQYCNSFCSDCKVAVF